MVWLCAKSRRYISENGIGLWRRGRKGVNPKSTKKGKAKDNLTHLNKEDANNHTKGRRAVWTFKNVVILAIYADGDNIEKKSD